MTANRMSQDCNERPVPGWLAPRRTTFETVLVPEWYPKTTHGPVVWVPVSKDGELFGDVWAAVADHGAGLHPAPGPPLASSLAELRCRVDQATPCGGMGGATSSCRGAGATGAGSRWWPGGRSRPPEAHFEPAGAAGRHRGELNIRHRTEAALDG